MNWKDNCLSDINIPNQWTDVSWHNDACPSYRFNGFQIWIAEKDKKLRELGEDSDRFYVSHYNYYGAMYTTRSFNNFNEVINYVSNNYGAWVVV